MSNEEDDVVMAGVSIGTAVPKNQSKPVYVALNIRGTEIYISTEDARDIANSIVQCADYVDRLNKKEGSIQ